MTSACEINNSLTSFTGICLVKADKQIKENAESPCVVSEDMAHGLFAFFA